MKRVAGGFVLGAFTDHHVHLQLVDHALLAQSVLGRVVDLGGNPEILGQLAASPPHNSGVFTQSSRAAAESSPIGEKAPELYGQGAPDIAFAGAFLTPPGGYPSMRAWAPEGSFREIPDADAAAGAVAEMKTAGASCIKIASNATAGPVFSDQVVRTIIEIAAAHSLPVVAHAEGRGEAQRVALLGVDALAHAPFSERLTDDEIAAQAASVRWVSTLAIHAGPAYATTVDNVRRFHAAGGAVLYGTDMGNGPVPVDLSAREIDALREAGLDDDDLIRVLAPVSEGSLLFIPGDAPDPLLARPLTPADQES